MEWLVCLGVALWLFCGWFGSSVGGGGQFEGCFVERVGKGGVGGLGGLERCGLLFGRRLVAKSCS